MSKWHALLIDDEEELVSTLVERLAYRGIEARYAVNGPQALELMENHPFDVVLLDLKLPGMSGSEVLAVIKQKWPGVPVIMITGHGGGEDAPMSELARAHDCLTKPVSIEILIAKMEEVLATR
ncbi:MAG: response regulator [candidate division Zixibacteria bacterium]|nr:response regulator [candidate division Zixibacteria bacterium]